VAFRLLRGASAGASGRVDRDALLALLKGGPGGARVPATTRIQQKLVEIWQGVLGLDEVGINEVFFDIGGTSLLSLRLFAEVERTLGVALPLATLYRASTIEALATLLEADPTLAAPDSIRLLSAGSSTSEEPFGGATLTLHLLHDSEGKTDVYHALADQLQGAVRVYAVAPHSEGPFPLLFTRVDDMAAHAAGQIRKVQPTGPYAIGGLGVGGTLAHAVACRLQAAGEVVASVVLFDAVDASYKQARSSGESGVFRKVDRGLAERLLASTSRLSTSLTRSGMDYARLKLLRRCLDRGEEPPWYLEHIPLETVFRFAAQDYVPRRFAGRMVLYRALDASPDPSDAPARDWCAERDFGWGARATLGAAVIDVSGGHRTMLAEPNVAHLARHLKEALTLALSGDGAAKRSA
jgi:thioesterase domain-containing protein/acyl carrier protein